MSSTCLEMIKNLLNCESQFHVWFQIDLEYTRRVTVSELEKFLRKVGKPLLGLDAG